MAPSVTDRPHTLVVAGAKIIGSFEIMKSGAVYATPLGFNLCSVADCLRPRSYRMIICQHHGIPTNSQA